MTFGKLVLAITCGILGAEAVDGVLFAARLEIENYRYRHRGASPTVQVDPYDQALDDVRYNTATRAKAIENYCVKTTIASGDPSRADQQMASCRQEANARMARDLGE